MAGLGAEGVYPEAYVFLWNAKRLCLIYMADFRLKVFLSVARNLSFTKASQELFITQPAITKHIHELESVYKTRLFADRWQSHCPYEGRPAVAGAQQTDTGRLQAVGWITRCICSQNECSGELRLGASTTIAQYVLPPSWHVL